MTHDPTTDPTKRKSALLVEATEQGPRIRLGGIEVAFCGTSSLSPFFI
jgi:hypothetical protein